MRYVRTRTLAALEEPWGWKDPRTTITLPFWLALFPDARVIHLVRNGIDVAESLYQRQLQGQSLARRRWKDHPKLFRLFEKKGWFGTSPRLVHRVEGVRLWEEYLSCADRHTTGLGERLKVVRFEDLVASPQETLPAILRFCDLAMDEPTIRQTLDSIRPQRGEAFRHNAELVELWRAVRDSEWMMTFGYGSSAKPTRS
jgi:hypothetical protein